MDLKTGYEKIRVRDTFDYPLVSVAAALKINKDKKIEDMNIVLGAIGTYPIINKDTTNAFVGEKISNSIIEEISEKIQKKAQPYNNLTMPVSYRKKMVGVLCRRLLKRLTNS